MDEPEVVDKSDSSCCCAPSQDSCRCGSCLRSSPCASVFGLVLGLLGIGAFSGGYLFGQRYAGELLNIDYLLPYTDYVCYGVLGGTVLFLFVVYIINSFSSGWNSKHFFDSSGKVSCGRCLTLSIVIIMAVSLILWCGMLVLTALPVYIHMMLWIRGNQLGNTAANYTFDLGYYGIYSRAGNEGLILEKSNTDYAAILDSPLTAAKTTFICYCVAFGGAFLVIISLLQLSICSAMNYARFEGIRYYDGNSEDEHPGETHF